jgi:bifunctional polynucleotide phosphatase/kinase
MNNKGLFLDMDGTLICTKSGETFPVDSDDWELIPEMVQWLKDNHDDYDIIVIVTNQAGIKYGYTTTDAVEKKIYDVKQALIKELDETMMIYHQYSAGYNSFFHKPNPGMAYSAAHFHEIDLSISTMIGDAGGRTGDFKDSDKVFAEKCNMEFIHVNDIINGKKDSSKD